MHEPMKDFTDVRWKELIKDFKKRIEEDKKQFDIKRSTYVELPEICSQPDYCLISMEPGAGNNRKEPAGNKRKEPEYRNFLANKGDFIINYCAYHFLGPVGFNYQITDMSKGELDKSDADRTQSERYRKWLQLLKEELNLFGNPKIIFIGKKLYDLNVKKQYLSVPEKNFIYHHSGLNKRWVKNYYESISNIKEFDPPADVEEKVKELAIRLMDMHNYHSDLKKKILFEEFNKKFNDHYKMLFAIYRYDFVRISQ